MSATRKILVTAAVLAAGTVFSIPPSSAQSFAAANNSCVHAFADQGFSGPDQWFCGKPGECHYVGDGWNDRMQSARTESDAKVELWDNADCTGGSITVDRTGYNEIGAWVSAFQVASS